MNLPKRLLAQYLGRFDGLISEGEEIFSSFQKEVIPGPTNWKGEGGRYQTIWKCDSQRLTKWEINCTSLIAPLIRDGTTLSSQISSISPLDKSKAEVEAFIGVLKALREDLERGFLDDLLLKVEGEVAADYMGQAEGLLNEGRGGQFDHVPAAVLTGAVLEKALRKLCDEHQPPIPTADASGNLKTLNPLIDDLKKVNVFNELKAKQLRAWADIRNKAAHGEFDQFKRTDVEQMIEGVKSFLADYLG
jgi:hypothetical protein